MFLLWQPPFGTFNAERTCVRAGMPGGGSVLLHRGKQEHRRVGTSQKGNGKSYSRQISLHWFARHSSQVQSSAVQLINHNPRTAQLRTTTVSN